MTSKSPRDIIIRPVVSEKSYAAFDENIYTFVVANDANKIEIRHAIEQIFSVRVTNVNTLNRSGKRKRNRRTGGYGTRPSTKRAVAFFGPRFFTWTEYVKMSPGFATVLSTVLMTVKSVSPFGGISKEHGEGHGGIGSFASGCGSRRKLAHWATLRPAPNRPVMYPCRSCT